MIPYTTSWEFVRWKGSVFPNALKWAIPSALATLLLRLIFAVSDYLPLDVVWRPPTNVETAAFSLYMSIFGFLMVFRAQMAYARFWQALTLVVQARAEWFNAAANLTAFCSAAPAKKEDVHSFRHLLVSLLSMLFCASLTEVSTTAKAYFQVLNAGIDEQSLQFLGSKAEKREILLQWIQQLVVDSNRSGVIDIAPPILSRVFHELSIGNVHFNTAKTFSDVPFPFPFAQMVWVMICFFSSFPAPFISAHYLPVGSGFIVTFLCVSTFWCIHYIAVELERPFGDDPNDLPLMDIQVAFNKSLAILLVEQLHSPPRLVPAAKLALQEAVVSLRPGLSMYKTSVGLDFIVTERSLLTGKGHSQAPAGGGGVWEVLAGADRQPGVGEGLVERGATALPREALAHTTGTAPRTGALGGLQEADVEVQVNGA